MRHGAESICNHTHIHSNINRLTIYIYTYIYTYIYKHKILRNQMHSPSNHFRFPLDSKIPGLYVKAKRNTDITRGGGGGGGRREEKE